MVPDGFLSSRSSATDFDENPRPDFMLLVSIPYFKDWP